MTLKVKMTFTFCIALLYDFKGYNGLYDQLDLVYDPKGQSLWP